MGGPSAAIVISELAELGAKRLLRVGTCGALERSIALGDLVIAAQAIPEDGTSRALRASGPVMPDPELVRALDQVAHAQHRPGRIHSGPVVSSDLFYDAPEGFEDRWAAAGAVAVEMETATLFTLAARRGLQAASLLLVSDRLVPARTRIGEEALRAGEATLGEVAAGALMTAALPERGEFAPAPAGTVGNARGRTSREA
jgi:uridine phosphorylase